jgi:hypothetical protein
MDREMFLAFAKIDYELKIHEPCLSKYCLHCIVERKINENKKCKE